MPKRTHSQSRNRTLQIKITKSRCKIGYAKYDKVLRKDWVRDLSEDITGTKMTLKTAKPETRESLRTVKTKNKGARQ